MFKDQIALNETGNVITDMNQKTNLEGVYAAGDLCVKNLRQVVTAVSDGAIAATSLERVIEEVLERTKLNTKKQAVHHVQTDETAPEKETEQFISTAMVDQLKTLYQKLNKDVHLLCVSDQSSFGRELLGFAEEFKSISDRLKLHKQEAEGQPHLSFVDETMRPLGLDYYAIPGGHEFTSFALAIYNAGSEGQPIDEELLLKLRSFTEPTTIKVMVSLSCAMCQEGVLAAPRMALENPHIQTEIYDLAHFEALKKQYQIMSVPCIVIDEHVYFGKKSLKEMVSLIETHVH